MGDGEYECIKQILEEAAMCDLDEFWHVVGLLCDSHDPYHVAEVAQDVCDGLDIFADPLGY